MFLLYSPLNQGLKLGIAKFALCILHLFLLYSPLNQGLKPAAGAVGRAFAGVFTLQSIKSRIET